jgi:hypothetical protein
MALPSKRNVGVSRRTLYDQDSYSWALAQARALRERRSEELDWDNLAEEVGDLARRHADALASHCEALIEHLLKLVYAPDPIKSGNRRLWRMSVRNSRFRIFDLLAANPRIKSATTDLFAKAWRYGRNEAIGKLDLAENAIPKQPLWTFEKAVDEKFDTEKARNPGK